MRLISLAVFLIPTLAFAAGSGGDSGTVNPPKPTETTQKCKGIQVWDAATKTCVNPKGSALDADTLYGAVRELAYAGRLHDAQGVLALMPDQNDDRVLTYWGFTWRKLGDSDLGREYYLKAIDRNPDNLLARSYMGQGMVAEGDLDGATVQLAEIRSRGGAGTWPEVSLAEALRSGQTYDY